MVGVRRIVGVLHLIPVPLCVLLADRRPGGYRVDAPVDEDAELGLLEPVRSLMARQGGFGGLVVRDAEGQPACARGDLGAAAGDGHRAVLGRARRGARAVADAHPDTGLLAGVQAADPGGLDGACPRNLDVYRHGVRGQDGDRSRVDDGGFDALGAGRLQERVRRPRLAQRQRASLGSGLQGQREHMQRRLVGLCRAGHRKGDRHGVALRVEPQLGRADPYAVFVLGAVRAVAVGRRQGSAGGVPVGSAEGGGRGRTVRVVDRGCAGGVAVAARGEEESREIAACGQFDALPECDDVVLRAGARGREDEGRAVDLDPAGGEFLAREGVTRAVEVTAACGGGVDAVVVVEGVEGDRDGVGDGNPRPGVSGEWFGGVRGGGGGEGKGCCYGDSGRGAQDLTSRIRTHERLPFIGCLMIEGRCNRCQWCDRRRELGNTWDDKEGRWR